MSYCTLPSGVLAWCPLGSIRPPCNAHTDGDKPSSCSSSAAETLNINASSLLQSHSARASFTALAFPLPLAYTHSQPNPLFIKLLPGHVHSPAFVTGETHEMTTMPGGSPNWPGSDTRWRGHGACAAWHSAHTKPVSVLAKDPDS